MKYKQSISQLIKPMLLCLLSISLSGQNAAINLATESFYSDKKIIQSKDFNERDFKDVYPFDPGDFFERGIDKFKSEFYKESLVDFNEAIKLSTGCSVCYYYRGLNYLALDSLEKAKSDLHISVEYDPLLIEAYNDLSVIYYFQNNLDSAKIILEKGIQYFPAYPLTYYNLGNIESERRKFNKAIKNFKKCLELEPCSKEAQYSLVGTYLDLIKIKKAESTLDDIFACDTIRSEVYLYKGIIKLAKSKRNKALEEIDKAIHMEDSIFFYHAIKGYIHLDKGEYKKAIKHITKAYSLHSLADKDYNASFLYQKTQEDFQDILFQYSLEKFSLEKGMEEQLDKILGYMINDNYFVAIDKLDKLKKSKSANAFTELLYGTCYEAINNFEKALEHYNNSIQLDESNYHTLYKRATLQQTQGKLTEAIKDFTKLYKLNPIDPKPLKLRGNARLELGELKLALADLQSYLRLDTSDLNTFYNIGVCYFHLKEYQNAINAYEAFLKKKENDIGAYYEIVQCKYNLGDHLGALNTCDSILSISDCHVQALNFKGVIYLDLNENDNAFKQFNKAIECSPNFIDGFINRSIIYMKQGKYQNALFDVNKVLKLMPDSNVAYYLRAKIKKEINDDSACEDLEKAMALNLKISLIEKNTICKD